MRTQPRVSYLRSHMRAPAFVAVMASLILLSGCSSEEPPPPEELATVEVKAEGNKSTLMLGETLQLSATGTSNKGQPFPVSTWTWTTSNAAVATVDANGLVTPAGSGSATISATSAGKKGDFALTVNGAVHKTDVTTSQTWKAADSPHLVVGHIDVEGSGAPILTIEAGATVKFAANASITVGGGAAGALVAAGTAAAPIKMQADAASPGKGHWEGLTFESKAGPSQLRHVTLSHCGGGFADACVEVYGTKPIFDNVTIDNSAKKGAQFNADGGFGVGSAKLTVTNAGDYALFIEPNHAGGIPTGGTFTGNAKNSVVLDVGQVSSTQAWPSLGIPYVVPQDITVQGSGAPVLTLPAGLELRFGPEAGLYVAWNEAGGLVVAGTAAAPVKFVADAATPAKGHWSGLDIRGQATTTELRYLSMSHCGNTRLYNACLRVSGASPLFDNVTVTGSGKDGVEMGADAGFGNGSTKLTVTDAANYPVVVTADKAGTVPTGGSFTGNGRNVVFLSRGAVGTTQTWPNLGIPYVVHEDLHVEGSGAPVLTLTAGTELRFDAARGLYVGTCGAGGAGTLIAVGTAASPIRFTANAATGTPGFWAEIAISCTATGSTRIEHAIVEYAAYQAAINFPAANILVEKELGPIVKNTIIRHSKDCGLWRRSPSSNWTTDFTDPQHGNTFASNPRNQCGPF